MEEKEIKVDPEERIKNLLNQRYQALAERLRTEPNIILRYELKLSIESVLEIYKLLFPEG